MRLPTTSLVARASLNSCMTGTGSFQESQLTRTSLPGSRICRRGHPLPRARRLSALDSLALFANSHSRRACTTKTPGHTKRSHPVAPSTPVPTIPSSATAAVPKVTPLSKERPHLIPIKTSHQPPTVHSCEFSPVTPSKLRLASALPANVIMEEISNLQKPVGNPPQWRQTRPIISLLVLHQPNPVQ